LVIGELTLFFFVINFTKKWA